MDRLVEYPSVIVRVACDHCRRQGRYRLARLVERFGADIRLADLLAELTKHCVPRRTEGWSCSAYFVEIGSEPTTNGAARPKRSAPGPVATLGQINTDPHWVWINCAGFRCGHRVPAALAPFV